MLSVKKMLLIRNPVLGMAFNKTATNLNNICINNKIRLYATETAVQKMSVRGMRRPRRRIDFDGLSWFLLIIPASAFGLGTWQVFRKFEKDKLNAEFMKIIDQPAVDFPKNVEDLNEMEYRRVRVRGKFDHSKEIFFGPRAKIEDYTDKMPVSLFSRSNPGYLIITPFKLADRDLTILVNRGWVPAKQKLASTRPEGQITGEVELVGLVRFHENREPLGIKNNPEKNIWVHRDLHQMSEITGASAVFLDADKTSSVPGGPIGGQTIVGLKNDHLSYIYTWYGLSIVSGYLWYVRHFQRVPVLV